MKKVLKQWGIAICSVLFVLFTVLACIPKTTQEVVAANTTKTYLPYDAFNSVNSKTSSDGLLAADRCPAVCNSTSKTVSWDFNYTNIPKTLSFTFTPNGGKDVMFYGVTAPYMYGSEVGMTCTITCGSKTATGNTVTVSAEYGDECYINSFSISGLDKNPVVANKVTINITYDGVKHPRATFSQNFQFVYGPAPAAVTIGAGTGVKSVYLSTTSTATSGSASGAKYTVGSTVYGFAELQKGYSAPSSWTKVSGTANTEGAKYRVGSVTAGSANFGTLSATAIKYSIAYTLNGGSVTGNPTEYTVTSNTFTLKNPTKTGYDFTGWTGSNGSTAQTSVQIAKGTIGNKTYTANYQLNAKVQNAINQINAIGEVTYPDSGEKIGEAAQALGELSAAEKALVSNAAALHEAELKYLSLELKSRVENFAEPVTYPTSKEEIELARSLYTEVYAENPNLISDETKNALIAAEEALELSRRAKAEVKIGEVYYDTFAEACEAAKSGDLLTLNNNVDLSNAPEDFLAIAKDLTIDLKGRTLTLGEEGTAVYAANGAAITIENSSMETGGVKGLFGAKYLEGSLITLKNVRTTFDKQTLLSEPVCLMNHLAAGFLAENLNEGEPDENGFLSLVRHFEAEDLIQMIGEIGEVEFTSECKAKIDAVRSAYEFLSDEQKAAVTNSNDLISAEERYASLGRIAAVEQKIDEIGTVEFTLESKGKIDTAREAFGKLTEAEQEEVSNYSILVAAEQAYAVMKDDHDKANAVDALILAIGTVEHTPECKAKIKAARQSYDALTQTQQSYVTKYPTLLAAEEAYDAFLTKYTITYVLNGGSFMGGATILYTNETETFTLPVPFRKGYHFAGWTGSNGEVAETQVVIEEGSEGNVSYLANWTAAEYTVLVGETQVTAVYDQVLPNVSVPVKEGYTFIGYYYEDGNDSDCYLDETGKGTKIWDLAIDNVSLTARYTKDISLTLTEYEGVYDGEAHSIQITLSDPTEGYSILYGLNENEIELTQLPTFTSVCEEVGGAYRVYFSITKENYTPYQGSGIVKITPAADEYSALPTAQTGLTYTGAAQSLLANVGAAKQGTMRYLVKSEGEVLSDWSSNAPAFTNVATYQVYYSTLGTRNFAPIQPSEENKVEVSILEVDKTALLAKINEVENYRKTISETYPSVSNALSGYLTQIGWSTYNTKNVTANDVAGAIQNLSTQLFAAKVSVTEAKIDGIGTLAYTAECKEKIDAAKGYFDSLTQEEQLGVAGEKRAALDKAISDYAAVDGAVKKTDACLPVENTASFRTKVGEARTAYENLTLDQKAFFPAEKLKLLTDYEAVIAAMDQVNACPPAENTALYQNKVSTARTTYQNLTDDQKALFPEGVLSSLVDYEAAIGVMNLVNTIGEVKYTAECKQKIDAANEGYEQLTDEQKALVVNYPTLEQANADYNAVHASVQEVNALGEVEFSETFREKLLAARGTYDALTANQKNIYPADVLKTLVDAEKAFDFMEKSHAMGTPENTVAFREKVSTARETYDKLTVDQESLVPPSFVQALLNAEAIVSAMDRVNEIGKVEYTAECKQKIDAARGEYDALTQEQTELFPEETLTTLLAAEQVYAALDSIETLPVFEEITLSDKTNVRAARKAYEELNDEQKELIPEQTLEKLAEAERKIAAIEKNIADTRAASAVSELIDALPSYDEALKEHEEQIRSARAAYEELTSAQKAKVSEDTLEKLIAAEQKLLDLEAAGEVEGLIDEIGAVEVTKECKQKIDAARAAYDGLTDAQKLLVQNVQTLTNSENSYSAAEKVIQKIDEIGAVEITEECFAKISAARTEYDSLAEGDKPLVFNYEKLLAAEEEYAAAKAVIEKINAIGDLEYVGTHNEDIDDAREAYDSLTDEQKALVEDQIAKLTSAEETYAELKKENETTVLTHEKSNVSVEVKEGSGIPNTVELKVEVKTSLSAEEKTEDFEAIQEKLEKNEKISKVYDVKLVQIVNGVETEIQPEDIEKGMVITIRMALPNGVSAKNLKILHIHSYDDMEFVEDYTLEGKEVSFHVDRLSEFAFISQKGLPVWAILLIVIVVLAASGVVVFFVVKKQKKDTEKKYEVSATKNDVEK